MTDGILFVWQHNLSVAEKGSDANWEIEMKLSKNELLYQPKKCNRWFNFSEEKFFGGKKMMHECKYQ